MILSDFLLLLAWIRLFGLQRYLVIFACLISRLETAEPVSGRSFASSSSNWNRNGPPHTRQIAGANSHAEHPVHHVEFALFYQTQQTMQLGAVEDMFHQIALPRADRTRRVGAFGLAQMVLTKTTFSVLADMRTRIAIPKRLDEFPGLGQCVGPQRRWLAALRQDTTSRPRRDWHRCRWSTRPGGSAEPGG